MADPFNPERFVDAQALIYEQARRELKAGRKQSHWMWFIFPQIAGLGQSAMSIRFAIASLDEAKAYLAHPVLGSRLKDCARLALDVEGKTARDIFGSIDEMKFRSSMTLFARAAPDEDVLQRCLDKYFAGAPTRPRLAGFSVFPELSDSRSLAIRSEPWYEFFLPSRRPAYDPHSQANIQCFDRAGEIYRRKSGLRPLCVGERGYPRRLAGAPGARVGD